MRNIALVKRKNTDTKNVYETSVLDLKRFSKENPRMGTLKETYFVFINDNQG